MPLISVIIPVFNDQNGIDICLNALSDQTYPIELYEVIIVDNGSNPPITIKPEFSNFSSLLLCQKPGSYAARNIGIKFARGEFIAFTDADCIPNQNWLEIGIETLLKDNGHSIIGGEVILSLSDRPSAVELYQNLSGFMQRENIEKRGFSVTANLFTNRAQFDISGLFNENLLSGGDREWCWRATKDGLLIKYVPTIIVYTKPRTSLVSAIRQTRRVAGGRHVFKQIKMPHVSAKNLKPHRTGIEAIKWILFYPKLSIIKKIKIFIAATIIKTAHFLETLKLKIGSKPTR